MLYRGQIALAFAILFGLITAGSVWYYFTNDRAMNEWYEVVMFGVAVLSAIVALLCAALSYVSWVPKWERVEKRTGRVPGERRNG